MLLLPCVLLHSPGCSSPEERSSRFHENRPGLFISTGSGPERLFLSKENIDKALTYAGEINAASLFVHAYINDCCLFDCGKNSSRNYKKASRMAGQDLFEYLLEKAQRSGIECYAWFNVFAFKGGHYLLKKYGKEVLTKDQHGRYFDGSHKSGSLDKYYRRDYLCWLEPGDPRVQEYLLGILEKLAGRYPLLKGVQLDFIRYPNDPPFIPGARYMKWGYSPGYGRWNVYRFHRKFKFYPDEKNIALEKNRKYSGLEKSLAWDNWRREQVTSFVKKAGIICKKYKKKLTASVFAYADRVYFHGFQDWRGWLMDNYVDFVILMNYSPDSKMVYHISKQHINAYPGRVWIGLGAYVMKNNPEILRDQLGYMNELKAPGTVIFEYFFIKNSGTLKGVIQNNILVK